MTGVSSAGGWDAAVSQLPGHCSHMHHRDFVQPSRRCSHRSSSVFLHSNCFFFFLNPSHRNQFFYCLLQLLFHGLSAVVSNSASTVFIAGEVLDLQLGYCALQGLNGAATATLQALTATPQQQHIRNSHQEVTATTNNQQQATKNQQQPSGNQQQPSGNQQQPSGNQQQPSGNQQQHIMN